MNSVLLERQGLLRNRQRDEFRVFVQQRGVGQFRAGGNPGIRQGKPRRGIETGRGVQEFRRLVPPRGLMGWARQRMFCLA